MKANKKQNFISTDQKTVRNSYGQYFTVGEEVGHEGAEDIATIIGFAPNIEQDEIRVYTTKGFAHIDFLVKCKQDPTIGLECIIDECELHIDIDKGVTIADWKVDDYLFDIFLDKDTNIFYAKHIIDGRIIKYKPTKLPNELTEDEAHRVLVFNLGRGYDKPQVVNLRDMFMQSEFIERIN